jgi:pyruvate/2-oxoglutarate dehydrogenase complex dihydrolipoamide dehydrogenase (E3) component
LKSAYDLVIIGAGSAGLTAANFAAKVGMRVALVERDRIGGDCTWTGCVPSKTLLKTAKIAHQMRVADRYGLEAVNPSVDLGAVMAHVREVVQSVYQEESPDVLRAAGIDVYPSAARFLTPHTLRAGGDTLQAHRFLIATGAHPHIPQIAGVEDVDYLTYKTIWGIKALPRRLLITGAGPVGCEMAQAFQRMGTAVTLVTDHDRVLPRDDPDASQVLAKVMEAEGIAILYNAPARRVCQIDGGVRLTAGDQQLSGDALLIASGRRPNTGDLDLEKAGVSYDEAGIRVDDCLRTSARHIYAAGDCTGGPQFTHYAGWQAFLAMRNALLPGMKKGIARHVPWTTFTDPEVAHAGLTEAQARDRLGERVTTCTWPMARVDRARAEDSTAGFIKLVRKKDDTLLGATIVAERAGEMIHEWIVALERRQKVNDLAGLIHVYPTYSTASMQVAAEQRIERLLNGVSGLILRGLTKLMRRLT